MNEKSERTQKATRVTKIGVLWNVFLAAIKFVTGYLGNSSALIADAVHSLSDFVSDLAVLAGLRIANKPKDSDHHYGHGKFETLSTVAITVTLFFAGGVMLWDSGNTIYKVYHGLALTVPKNITLWIAFLSIIIKEGLYHYTFRAGKSIDSNALITNAWHHRTDALSSIAVTIGIAGAIWGGPSWRILDPIAALIISIIIIRFALGVFKDAINELMEASLSNEMNKEILQIASEVPGVYNPHNLKTRKIGYNYALEMHVKVDPKLTIVEAHDIATDLENKLKEKYGADTFLSIHIEPCERMENEHSN